jgi:hypothetical protein
MITSSVPLTMVSIFMGHSSIVITEATDFHLMPRSLADAKELMDASLTKALGPTAGPNTSNRAEGLEPAPA